MIRALLFIFICFPFAAIFAQTELAIGEWASFLPHDKGTYVTESDDYIFYVSDQVLTRFDKETKTPKPISTLDGLSSVGVRLASYNKEEAALVVIYNDSKIDIIYEDEIININDIERNTQLTGDRSIRNLFQWNDKVILAAGFGILIIDLEVAVITDVVLTPSPVDDVTIWNGQFIANTAEQIYTLDTGRILNFEFWSQWDNKTIPWGLSEDIFAVETFDNKLFLSKGNALVMRNGNETIQIDSFERKGDTIRFLQSGYNYLLTGIKNPGDRDFVRFYNTDLSTIDSPTSCHGNLSHAIETREGEIFYGDRFGGFRFSKSPAESCEFTFIPGPKNFANSDIDYRKGTLAIAGGGPRDQLRYEFADRGMYILKEGEWNNVNPDNTEALSNPEVLEFFRILIDPFDEETIWVGTYWGGVVRYREDETRVYTKENSCLEGAVGDEKRERIAGMAFDEAGNLWVTNYLAPQGLKVFRTNGDCEGRNLPTSSSLVDLHIDPNGFLWSTVFFGDAGILVFDPDPDGINGERFKVFNRSNSALPTNDVTCLTIDRSGNVWAGTTEGVVLFACGSAVFDFDCSSRPIVTEDNSNVGDFLLNNVRITALGVDGANRKWVGTEGGVIVLSPSGNEELFRFTTNNSPLFSNSIVDFAYDGESGVMYIATGQGVMAYRTQSTKGESFNQPDAFVYPNPVRPEYDGPIAIKGVAEDALVKITDIEGRLVHETRALGGQAIWDGKQWNGERVASGVYLAWITGRSDFAKPSDAVLKFVVIN
ncbi:MAG: hypothetical protein GVX96_00910 [Bacteroidetes bacterium]|jgi:hypothetical protein|nr:hypothetical protein [Bacteroidota bacterium]